MDRIDVIRIAVRTGWTQCGGLRRYGPDWFECYRRGRQYVWIGMRYVCGAPDEVTSGFHKSRFNFERTKDREAVKEWFN